MTIELMRQFGVHTLVALDHPAERPRELRVLRAPYMARDYAVEPDASSATYFMAAAAARPGASVTIPGLGTRQPAGRRRLRRGAGEDGRGDDARRRFGHCWTGANTCAGSMSTCRACRTRR